MSTLLRLPPRCLAVLIIIFISSAYAWASNVTSHDAYVRFDERTNIWTLGTSKAKEKIQLADGAYTVMSWQNKASGAQYVFGTTRPEDFRITVDGTDYTGASGGWVLKDNETKVLPHGEIQLVVRLDNGFLSVEKTYVVYPGTSIIRQWTTYQNVSSHPIKVSNPYFLALRVRVDERNQPVLNYMTGGGDFTGSQMLKQARFSGSFARTFDTTDKPEKETIGGINFGSALPYGSGAYMPWFCIRNTTSREGLFVGFDYYGRWAARIGNYFGGPGYLGLVVAGYEKELAPRESIVTPMAFTGVFTGDLDDMGNVLKDWQYQYLWDYVNNNYFAKIRYSTEMQWQTGKDTVAWGGGTQDNWDFRLASQFHAIDVMRYVGADILWQDAGWHDHLGDNDGPDFSGTNRYLRKYGMRLAVWWPLYSVAKQSRVYQEHPDWRTNSRGIGGSNLNTSKIAVINYLLGQLNEKVAKWGNFQWRLDGTAVVPVNGNETPLLTEYHNVANLQKDFRKLHPRSSIDICSGGGNLMGFETLRVSDVSQLTDGGALHIANYYSSYLFPPDKIDDWTRDANFTWSNAMSSLTMASAWTGDRGLYGDEPGLILNRGVENLRRVFDIYRYLVAQHVAGRWSLVYHPRVTGDDPVYYFERLSGDRQRGVIILKHFVDREITIYPKGLEPARPYDVRFQRLKEVFSLTGTILMKKGITLFDPAPGELIYLGLPNHPGSGTDHVSPSNPVNVKKRLGVNMGVTDIEIDWSPATDNNWLSYYQIYRDGKPIDKVAQGTYYFDHSFEASLSADYQVQAVDGDGNVSQKVEAMLVPGGKETYTAWGGFLAGKDYSYQGANGWSYEEWVSKRHISMTWNGGLGHMGLYQGEPEKREALVGASWMQPSESGDAVRVFSVPYSGIVTVMGRVHKDIYHTYGDGVRVRVFKNDQQVWPNEGWEAIGPSDTTGKNIDLRLSVKKGDKLYFDVNCNVNSVGDETVWNPEITFDRIDRTQSQLKWDVIDNNSSQVKYSGHGWEKLGVSPWGGDADEGYLSGRTKGTFSVTGTAGDTVRLRFRGTGIYVLGDTGGDGGIATIFLDGNKVTTIDTFVPSHIPKTSSAIAPLIHPVGQWEVRPETRLWGVRGLPDAQHEIEIVATGRKKNGSRGTRIGIDAFVIRNSGR